MLCGQVGARMRLVGFNLFSDLKYAHEQGKITFSVFIIVTTDSKENQS